jgi:hypothetical protein
MKKLKLDYIIIQDIAHTLWEIKNNLLDEIEAAKFPWMIAHSINTIRNYQSKLTTPSNTE